jgi:hypothetical protein
MTTSYEVRFRLRDAVGFGVTDVNGHRFGRIDEIVEPDAFVVRSGFLGRRISLLHIDQVVEILPILRVVVVTGGGPRYA